MSTLSFQPHCLGMCLPSRPQPRAWGTVPARIGRSGAVAPMHTRKIVRMAASDGQLGRETDRKPQPPRTPPGFTPPPPPAPETEEGGGLPPMPPKPPGKDDDDWKPYFPSRRNLGLILLGGYLLKGATENISLGTKFDPENDFLVDDDGIMYLVTPKGRLLQLWSDEQGSLCFVDENTNIYCASGIDDETSAAGGVNAILNDGEMINVYTDAKGRLYKKELGRVEDLVAVRDTDMGDLLVFEDPAIFADGVDLMDADFPTIEEFGDSKPKNFKPIPKDPVWFDPNKKGFLGF